MNRILTLSDISEFIVDCEHKTAPIVEYGIPSVRTTDLKNGRIVLESCNRVSVETYKEWTSRLEPQPDDIILSREAPVGEVGIVPPNAKLCLGQRTVLIRLKKDQIVPRFLLYLFLTDEMRHELISRSEGSVVPHLNMSDIRSFPLPDLPPLPTQHAIAHILGTLDDKIELNRRINETLEAMARAIFKSWFVDFDPVRAKAEGRKPGGMDAETAALFPSEFEMIDGREVPKGWRVDELGEIAENIRRPINPDQVEPETPYIGLEHMPQHSIALPSWGAVSSVESGKFVFKKNEFLFGKLRPYFHKVGIAPIDGLCSTDILVIGPKLEYWASYVICCISSDDFVKFTNLGSDGTRMPRTNWSFMKKFPIIIAPEHITAKFNSIMHPLFENINSHIHQSRTLAQIRDMSLPKLISGELQVPYIEREVEKSL